MSAGGRIRSEGSSVVVGETLAGRRGCDRSAPRRPRGTRLRRSASTRRERLGVELVSGVACASSGTRYCPSLKIRTITTGPRRARPPSGAAARARPAPRAPAAAGAPEPSSAFIFASSSSTAPPAPIASSWRSRSSLPGADLRQVVEGAVGLELADRGRPGLHVLGLVERALHREADVRHLLADAGRRLGDPHLGLGGRVLGLDDLLLGAEGLELRAHRGLRSRSASAAGPRAR